MVVMKIHNTLRKICLLRTAEVRFIARATNVFKVT